MPRILDNILDELNLSIKQNLNAVSGYTNLGNNSQFYNQTQLTQKDDIAFPVVLTGDYKGTKISLDDRYPLQIYHRIINANSESDPNSGYGAKSYYENIYEMRLYCLGTLKNLNNPDHDFNVDIMETVYYTLPHALSYRERILPQDRSANVLEILSEEFSGAMTKNLITRHVAFTIDYNIRQRSDCTTITNTPVIVFSDIAGLTANQFVVT